MKIEIRSRKQSHKLDGIGVGKSERSISSDSVFGFVANDPVITLLPESEAEAEVDLNQKNQPGNRKAKNRALRLVYSSAAACDSNNAVSLDGKRRSHKRNRCYVPHSFSLIFTRSFRSASDYNSDNDSVASEVSFKGLQKHMTHVQRFVLQVTVKGH